MSRVNATSDSIESVFGVLDNTLKFASDNVSKHSGNLSCMCVEHINVTHTHSHNSYSISYMGNESHR